MGEGGGEPANREEEEEEGNGEGGGGGAFVSRGDVLFSFSNHDECFLIGRNPR